MGTDNLFHKRKSKKAVAFRREQSKYEPYDIILIVCEGGKSEPKYFQEFRDYFKLSAANIRVVGDLCGSSPRDVVNFAIAEYRKAKRYNRIFCVFDKDRHPTFKEAIDRIHSIRLPNGDSIQAIPSIPCFEIWLLLHFTYTTRSFGSKSTQGSICESIIAELKRHLPAYTKGADNLFTTLRERLPGAINNAKKLETHCATCDTNNPSTQIHRLAEYLMNLKHRFS